MILVTDWKWKQASTRFFVHWWSRSTRDWLDSDMIEILIWKPWCLFEDWQSIPSSSFVSKIIELGILSWPVNDLSSHEIAKYWRGTPQSPMAWGSWENDMISTYCDGRNKKLHIWIGVPFFYWATRKEIDQLSWFMYLRSCEVDILPIRWLLLPDFDASVEESGGLSASRLQ